MAWFRLIVFFFSSPLFAQEWVVTRGEGPWPVALRRIAARQFGPEGRFAILEADTRAEVKSLVGELRVQPNYPYRALGLDPELPQSWGLSNVGQEDENGQQGKPGVDTGAAAAWALGPFVEALVGVVDSGIDLDHPELKGRVWRNTGETPANGIDDDGNGYIDDINGWDFDSRTARVQDDFGHGSMISGIIAAEAGNGEGTRGVHPNARILVAKALDKFGIGSTESAISAITYAVSHGARILNASWVGSPGTELEFAL